MKEKLINRWVKEKNQRHVDNRRHSLYVFVLHKQTNKKNDNKQNVYIYFWMFSLIKHFKRFSNFVPFLS